MTAPRRRRAATVEKATRLLDATEEIILREGYAAVSSRSVAARVAITAPLVHYYFPTIDDLFVAVLRRRAQRTVEQMTAALASAEPLRAWWELVSDSRATALTVEFAAAANHRPALRAEVGRVARELRQMQIEKLATILGEYGLDPDEYPPELVAATIQGLAFVVVADRSTGYDTAPEEAVAAMTRLVARLEEKRARRPPPG
ncbi:TetR/AcrR family transcriptional regulator [Parafrankia discariae]|uniref:TetR/AcrR family transcriptional regulator n=1 Tax=Parafrankia discariae TaxID=365528 RepID=UPI000369B0DC|nr:TetR/AcrR family transcriptional regulator [Parafrankia discariae]